MARHGPSSHELVQGSLYRSGRPTAFACRPCQSTPSISLCRTFAFDARNAHEVPLAPHNAAPQKQCLRSSRPPTCSPLVDAPWAVQGVCESACLRLPHTRPKLRSSAPAALAPYFLVGRAAIRTRLPRDPSVSPPRMRRSLWPRSMASSDRGGARENPGILTSSQRSSLWFYRIWSSISWILPRDASCP